MANPKRKTMPKPVAKRAVKRTAAKQLLARPKPKPKMADESKPKREATPTPREDEIVPADAPTDYPPVGVAVSTGTAWDTSIPVANVANTANPLTFTNTASFNGTWTQVNGTFYSAGVANFGLQGNWACTIHTDGSLYAPSITVAGSPVVTVAMLDPAVVNARLDALEAAQQVPPPADDPRSQTRAALLSEAQANQDYNDQIFQLQREEAERVENIQNPPLPS